MASFYNPEFFMRQRQRLSTFNTPRVVSTYDINERYIILPRGLYSKLKLFFKNHNVQVSVEDKRSKIKVPKQDLCLTLRDEQKKAKKKILKNDYALLIAPPGFGKTAVAASVISERRVSTLILVHKTVLLEQWSKKLSEYYKIDIKSIGILGKGKKKLNGVLDVATLQSLKNRPELIENYSQIIIDEAHHMPISYPERIIQYLGRIGREGQQCLAVDFIDTSVPMLKSSFNKRMKGYKKMGYVLVPEQSLFEEIL
jgi:superfamily II DNA or RNA helicase